MPPNQPHQRPTLKVKQALARYRNAELALKQKNACHIFITQIRSELAKVDSAIDSEEAVDLLDIQDNIDRSQAKLSTLLSGISNHLGSQYDSNLVKPLQNDAKQIRETIENSVAKITRNTQRGIRLLINNQDQILDSQMLESEIADFYNALHNLFTREQRSIVRSMNQAEKNEFLIQIQQNSQGASNTSNRQQQSNHRNASASPVQAQQANQDGRTDFSDENEEGFFRKALDKVFGSDNKTVIRAVEDLIDEDEDMLDEADENNEEYEEFVHNAMIELTIILSDKRFKGDLEKISPGLYAKDNVEFFPVPELLDGEYREQCSAITQMIYNENNLYDESIEERVEAILQNARTLMKEYKFDQAKKLAALNSIFASDRKVVISPKAVELTDLEEQKTDEGERNNRIKEAKPKATDSKWDKFMGLMNLAGLAEVFLPGQQTEQLMNLIKGSDEKRRRKAANRRKKIKKVPRIRPRK
jgi:hypothetical protein